MTLSTFHELRQIIADLPVLDHGITASYWERDKVLTKPEKALGRLEDLGAWFALASHRYPMRLQHPRVSIFAANHGVTVHGVSAYPAEVTAQMVHNFEQGGAAVNQLAAIMDADLKVHTMALDVPSQDFCTQAALTEQECCSAMAYGMMDANEGIDIICLGEMGIGNSTAAAALCYALYGGQAADWVGHGTGVAGDALHHKIAVVEQAIETHRAVIDNGDGLDILACFGGLELAAIAGAIIATRMGHIPVLLDGFACTAAAAVLQQIRPDILDHCQVGHLSKEPGHARLLHKLDKKPLLDLHMGLGEGSGAVLALGLVQAAVACHHGMATFEEAAVSNKTTPST